MSDERHGDTAEAREPRAVDELTLYGMSGDLWQLLALREELIEVRESTEAVDADILTYFRGLARKEDGVVHVLGQLKAQERLAVEERDRLEQRAKSFQAKREHLEGYVMRVLAQLPEPRGGGARRLEGETASLVLARNGGVEPLEVYDESLVPDEYCTFTAELTSEEYAACRRVLPESESLRRAVRYADSKRIRRQLLSTCRTCMGSGFNAAGGVCANCGGGRTEPVAGARLKGRGHHLRIS